MRHKQLVRLGASVLLALFATAEMHEVLLLVSHSCMSHARSGPGIPQPHGNTQQPCAFCTLLGTAALVPYPSTISALAAESADTEVPTYLSLRWSDLAQTPESRRGPPLSATA